MDFKKLREDQGPVSAMRMTMPIKTRYAAKMTSKPAAKMGEPKSSALTGSAAARAASGRNNKIRNKGFAKRVGLPSVSVESRTSRRIAG